MLTPVVDLDGGEVLHLPDAPSYGVLAPLPEGGWIYAGFAEEWTWGEFGAEGELIRAPGKRWTAGGPGEFRSVRGVFPVRGDTLVVLEEFMVTRVLRDGTYLDRNFVGFEPSSRSTKHRGDYWVGGRGGPGEGAPVLHISGSGDVRVIELERGDARIAIGSLVSAHPVVWDGELWVWQYPYGPFRRLDETSGQVLEAWEPPIEGARAFAAGGPEGTVIFRVVRESTGSSEWVVFGPDRERVLVQPVPERWRGSLVQDARYSRGFVYADSPVRHPAAIRVYEYEIVRPE